MTERRPSSASPSPRRGALRAWLASTSVWQRAMLGITLASGLGVVAVLLWALAHGARR